MRDRLLPGEDRLLDSTEGRGMSLLNAMYYAFKPFLPQAARYTMRRLRMNHILQRTDDWPIMASAATPPAGWNGWPDGKDFALLLTHDVEGQAGLERCIRLAELEAKHGFRSSFNLIPEGGYVIPPELRHRLEDMGFEIGVHDLRHDGSLFRSRRSFDECAPRINTHLKEWKAVGFRAGFMFHNLEWIKALDIEYDASTFDTDPFEPQPDGVGTIFPFAVDDVVETLILLTSAALSSYLREEQLRSEINRLQIQIDPQRMAQQVTEITETDFFQDLQARAKQMRRQKRK